MGNPTLFEAAPPPAEAHGGARGYAGATQSSGDVAAAERAGEALRGEAWPASLEPSCLAQLRRLSAAGVALSEHPHSPVFLVSFAGELANDGSCLFAAVARAADCPDTAAELRHRVVKRVLADAGAGLLPRDIDASLERLYCPDMSKGWGVHFVQERKLLMRAVELPAALTAIEDLVATGMDRARAAELVYGERATPVSDVQSWAQFMACDGQGGSESRIITMRYCEEGLLDVDDDVAGQSAAFGDELALCGLATELRRHIHVVQVHGAEAGLGVDEAALFFLPHAPLPYATSTTHANDALPPIFLLMRGTSWCAGGGDHFEPCFAVRAPQGTVPAFTL